MALSNLTFLNSGTSPNVAFTSFLYPPTTSGGNLENELELSIAGYATSNNHLIVFSVFDTAYTQSSLSLKSDNSSINLTDTRTSNNYSNRSWYTVDMGTDTVNGSDWSLKFNITLKDLTTPSFIFVKGKSTGRPRNI